MTFVRPRLAFFALLVCQVACNAIFGLDDLEVVGGGAGGAGGAGVVAGAGGVGGEGGSLVGPCTSATCNEHGTCDDSTGNAECSCDQGWGGASCAACAAGYTGADCKACAPGYQDADDDGSCLAACTDASCSSNGVCDESTGVATCTCYIEFSGDDCATPCPAGMAGSACEFRIVYGLDLPTNADWNVLADVPYDIDETAAVGSFDRVAYRLLLDDEEVWVEMDAFTNDAAMLGVPTDWVWDIAITNALVVSVSPNQSNVAVPTAGNLELWSACYSEGPNGVFDDDDTIGGGTDCYGSMQVHVAMNTVLALNHWSQAGTLDVGIGEAPSGNPDWTFSGNAGSFLEKRLEVYVRE